METPSAPAPAPAPSAEALAAEVARLRAELAARDAEVLSLQAALNQRDSIISGFNDHVPGGLLMLDRAPDGRRVIPVASQGLATRGRCICWLAAWPSSSSLGPRL